MVFFGVPVFPNNRFFSGRWVRVLRTWAQDVFKRCNGTRVSCPSPINLFVQMFITFRTNNSFYWTWLIKRASIINRYIVKKLKKTKCNFFFFLKLNYRFLSVIDYGKNLFLGSRKLTENMRRIIIGYKKGCNTILQI